MNRAVIQIPLKQIVESVDNSRQVYDEREMAELMVSMRQTGLLQPIGVKELKAGHYKLVFGFRRFHAAHKLGWKHIDCVLVNSKNNEEDMIQNSIENIQRSNPSFEQQGRIFQGLVKRGLTAAQIAARIGCTPLFVRNALDGYYRIPKHVQKKISQVKTGRTIVPGKMSPTAAFKVARVTKEYKLNEGQAMALYDYVTQQNVGVPQMYVVANLLDQGYSPREAIALCKKTRIVSVQFAVDIEQCAALERKYKLKIHDIAYSWLEQNKEMDIYPMRQKHREKTVVVTRKAGAK